MSGDTALILSEAHGQLRTWNLPPPPPAPQVRRGNVLAPGAQFIINVNGDWRDADGSWTSHQRYARYQPPGRITEIPHFVTEVRSPRQTRRQQKSKMVEWIEAGVQSGMLIDPFSRVTFVYARNNGLLLPAGVAIPLHGTVVKVRHNWPANAGPGQGPALIVNGVGKVAGFSLNHQLFPM